MKRHIPNLLTLCNLSCGVAAVLLAYNGHFVPAAWMFLAGVAFDFFDGFAARMLHVKSDIGRELDSLADCITSGLLPSMVMYKLMQGALAGVFSSEPFSATVPVSPLQLAAVPALLIVLFSALRLAKFNLDTRQTESFIGLPTPACGLVVVFLPFFAQWGWGQSALSCYWILLALTVVLSLLLVSEVPLFALKFKTFGWKGNQKRWVLIALAALAVLTLGFRAFPLVVLAYVLMSLLWKDAPGASSARP